MASLEKGQILLYLLAAGLGLLIGSMLPQIGGSLAPVLWPALGLLLYATFVQVPLHELRPALSDGRFIGAAILGNFAVVPVLVFGIVHLLPADPALRLGVLLVLLLPCTDWFIAFTRLGGGDASRAIAFAPVSLLLQALLLPVYLTLFFGTEFVTSLAQEALLMAFLGLILLPLLLAWFTRRFAPGLAATTAWLPIPLLAWVILLVTATQVTMITGSLPRFGVLLGVFAAYLMLVPALAWALARLFQLPPVQARTLTYSLGSRNSFVVLPLALALPETLQFAALVIVFQSLVELLGMLAYLRWLPKLRDSG